MENHITITGTKQIWTKTFILVIFSTAIIWAISPFILAAITFPGLSIDWSSRSSFGDSFGALNTLFAGIGLAALIATLLLQARGIDLQAKQLLESQVEQKRIAMSQITAAKLQGLASLLHDANDCIKKIQAVIATCQLNERLASMRTPELSLWFEKRRLLVKRISQLVQEIDESNELMMKMAKVEKRVGQLSGLNRPFGKDGDESED